MKNNKYLLRIYKDDKLIETKRYPMKHILENWFLRHQLKYSNDKSLTFKKVVLCGRKRKKSNQEKPIKNSLEK